MSSPAMTFSGRYSPMMTLVEVLTGDHISQEGGNI
jgi:hypothetical protein